MIDPVRFDQQSRGDLNQRAENALVVIPVGATEQHGPGLPTGTDTLSAETVALGAARQARATVDVLVAPSIAYGCSSHHLPHGATLSLESHTLLNLLLDVGASAAVSGFRRVFYLNGHGGNHELVQLAAREVSLSSSIHAAGGSWWDMAREELLRAGGAVFPRVPGHAGGFEASILTAIQPDLVRLDEEAYAEPHQSYPKPAVPYRSELAGFWTANDGYTDKPTEAELSAGRRLLETAIDVVAQHLIDFYRSTEEIEDFRRPGE